MNCIFCNARLKPRILFCDQCHDDRFQVQKLAEKKFSREGQLLEKVVKDKYDVKAEVYSDSLNVEFRSMYRSKKRLDLIRVLSLPLGSENEVSSTFQKEAKKWTKIKHPSLVTPFGSGRQGKVHFAISLFPEGIRLSELLAAGGDLPLQWGLQLFYIACARVKSCHRKGIPHGNIKPSSFYVKPDGSLSLGGVGLVNPLPTEFFNELIPADIALYASPEQLKGGAAELKSDLYSLALLGYVLLTGINPYETEKEVNILYKNLHEPVIPALALRKEIPVTVSDMITKNLNKSPRGRSSKIDEMVTVLADSAKSSAPSEKTRTLKSTKTSNYKQLINEGREYYFKGRYKKALECWRTFLEYEEDNFAVLKYVYCAEQRLENRVRKIK